MSASDILTNNNIDKSPAAKIKRLEECGINEIHNRIKLEGNTLTIDVQVGNPDEEGYMEGCSSTHIYAALVKMHEQYNRENRSRETSVVITKTEEAMLWSQKRKLERELRGVLNTDKK